MIKHRPASTRKHLCNDWIETYRSFSNNSYWNPNYINYSLLEVINDDRVQPHSFVPIHQHMDMEILGYVIDGKCYHNDNLRNITEVPSGGVQHMSSGSGIWHIEGNNTDKPNRYLQIWLRPNVMNLPPVYDGYVFDREDKLNNFCLIARSFDAPIIIKSDAIVRAGIFTKDYTYKLNNDKKYYLYIINGSITLDKISCTEGDAIIYENENLLTIESADNSEVIMFELI